jgi:hypothetical protein
MTQLESDIIHILELHPFGVRLDTISKILGLPSNIVSITLENLLHETLIKGNINDASALYYLNRFAPRKQNEDMDFSLSGNPNVSSTTYLDSGYFYCPYIPDLKPPVLDPESFKPRKNILTRYGKKLIEEGAKFYARLSLHEEPKPKPTENDVNIVEEE